MTTRRKMFTADEFEQFVKLPQNANRRFEYINGELVEVPSNPYSSQIAALIIAALVYFWGMSPGSRAAAHTRYFPGMIRAGSD